MPGTLRHYQWMIGAAEEMLRDDIIAREVDELDVGQRIAQAVLIARRIMLSGYSAMARNDNSTDLEVPRPEAMAAAARTIACAGAIVRAAALAAFFRIRPVDED